MRKNLQLIDVLKPGEAGTEELVEQFGDALVCVRRWYDPERDLELTTAEVVESSRPWQPRRHPGKMYEPRSPRWKY